MQCLLSSGQHLGSLLYDDSRCLVASRNPKPGRLNVLICLRVFSPDARFTVRPSALSAFNSVTFISDKY